MTRTSYTIHDLGGRLRWSTLAHFLRYLPIDSAYVRETHPEMAEQIAWMDGKVTAKVLADLIDEVRGLEHMYARAHTKHGVRVPAPQPYETPWTSDQSAGRRRYGKDPIPIADFDAWWDAQGSSRHTDAS